MIYIGMTSDRIFGVDFFDHIMLDFRVDSHQDERNLWKQGKHRTFCFEFGRGRLASELSSREDGEHRQVEVYLTMTIAAY